MISGQKPLLPSFTIIAQVKLKFHYITGNAMVRMSILHSKPFTPCDRKHKMQISLSDNHFSALVTKTPIKLLDISMNELSVEIFTNYARTLAFLSVVKAFST